MAANAWKKAVWPGAGKNTDRSPDGKGLSNGVKSYEDTHGMERHQHGPDPVGKGKVIDYDD